MVKYFVTESIDQSYHLKKLKFDNKEQTGEGVLNFGFIVAVYRLYFTILYERDFFEMHCEPRQTKHMRANTLDLIVIAVSYSSINFCDTTIQIFWKRVSHVTCWLVEYEIFMKLKYRDRRYILIQSTYNYSFCKILSWLGLNPAYRNCGI